MPWSRPTFRHGVHPEESKDATRALPIERMPFVDEYVLPLSQHTGAPSRAIVEPGDRVVNGREQVAGRCQVASYQAATLCAQ